MAAFRSKKLKKKNQALTKNVIYVSCHISPLGRLWINSRVGAPSTLILQIKMTSINPMGLYFNRKSNSIANFFSGGGGTQTNREKRISILDLVMYPLLHFGEVSH